MEEDKRFSLKIITPERIFYEGKVRFVELVTTEGEVGIYKNHIPMTNILSPGVITIHEEGEKKKAALHAGFMEILEEAITILAEIAEWPDEIDANRAKEAQIRAQRRLKTHDSQINAARAEMSLRRALTRLAVKDMD